MEDEKHCLTKYNLTELVNILKIFLITKVIKLKTKSGEKDNKN